MSTCSAFRQSSKAIEPSCWQVTQPPPQAWAITGACELSRMTAERRATRSAMFSAVKVRQSTQSL